MRPPRFIDFKSKSRIVRHGLTEGTGVTFDRGNPFAFFRSAIPFQNLILAVKSTQRTPLDHCEYSHDHPQQSALAVARSINLYRLCVGF